MTNQTQGIAASEKTEWFHGAKQSLDHLGGSCIQGLLNAPASRCVGTPERRLIGKIRRLHVLTANHFT